jgi:hypothetical protein
MQELSRGDLYYERVWQAPRDMPQEVVDCVRDEAHFQVRWCVNFLREAAEEILTPFVSLPCYFRVILSQAILM